MDVQSIIASVEATGRAKERETGATVVALSDEQLAAWRQLLAHFEGKMIPFTDDDGKLLAGFDELIPSELREQSASNRAANLAASLRARLTPEAVEGGDGTYLWITGTYSAKTNRSYVFVNYRIPERAKAYQRALDAGVIGADGKRRSS